MTKFRLISASVTAPPGPYSLSNYFPVSLAPKEGGWGWGGGTEDKQDAKAGSVQASKLGFKEAPT